MKSKLWTKDFISISLINFLIAINYFLLTVVMAKYAMHTFGASLSEAGLVSSIFIIGTLAARLFTGFLVERAGLKRMIFAGTILSLAMTLLYFGTSNIMLLLVIRFVHGAGYGIASTTAGTIVANIIPENRRGEGIGYYMLSMTLSTAIGPFLGLFLIRHGSYAMIFTACSIFAALGIVNVFFLTVPKIKLTSEQIAEMKQIKWSNFFEIKAIPISLICAAIYFGYSSVLSFIEVYAEKINLVDAAGFFFVVYAAAVFISRPLSGQLFDKKGENVIMYPAFVAFGIGMIIISFAYSGLILLAGAAFIGFGLGAVQPCGQAIAVKLTPKTRFGLAVSTFFIFADLGIGIGPFILGLFIPFAGYSGIYLAMAALSLSCVLLYYLFYAKRRLTS